MKKLSYLLVVFLFMGQVSCIKLLERSTKDLLTDDEWEGVSYKITMNGQIYDQGSLNASLEFNENGRYRYEDYDTGDTEEGDWELRNDNKEIYIDPDNDIPQTMYIDHLDDTRFECHVVNGGVRADYVFTQ